MHLLQSVFEFLVPLAPEVTLGDYQSVRRDYEPEDVTDDDVTEVLQNIRESQAIIETVDRAAAEGDVVYLTLNGQEVLSENGEVDESQVYSLSEQHLNFLIHPEEENIKYTRIVFKPVMKMTLSSIEKNIFLGKKNQFCIH